MPRARGVKKWVDDALARHQSLFVRVHLVADTRDGVVDEFTEADVTLKTFKYPTGVDSEENVANFHKACLTVAIMLGYQAPMSSQGICAIWGLPHMHGDDKNRLPFKLVTADHLRTLEVNALSRVAGRIVDGDDCVDAPLECSVMVQLVPGMTAVRLTRGVGEVWESSTAAQLRAMASAALLLTMSKSKQQSGVTNAAESKVMADEVEEVEAAKADDSKPADEAEDRSVEVPKAGDETEEPQVDESQPDQSQADQSQADQSQADQSQADQSQADGADTFDAAKPKKSPAKSSARGAKSPKQGMAKHDARVQSASATKGWKGSKAAKAAAASFRPPFKAGGTGGLTGNKRKHQRMSR